MTLRHLPLIVGALLFSGVAAGAPAPAARLRAAGAGAHVEAVRVRPPTAGLHPLTTPFDVHLGDGIFRLRIQGCDTCEVSLTIEVGFGQLWRLIRSS